MIIAGPTLLAIDRAFKMPHRLSEMLLNPFQKISDNASEEILVIKFMGIGSIIRLASLCEIQHIDKTRVTFITLSKNLEVCRLLGFDKCWLVRTKNPVVFMIDCVKWLLAVRSLRPACIIDYERGSYAVGLYRTWLAWCGQCKSLSFESNRKRISKTQIIHPVEEVTLEELFLKGIEWMPKVQKPDCREKFNAISNKILININSSNYLLARRYDIASYAEVIKSLHVWNPLLEFYLTGTRAEAKYVDQLLKRLPGLVIHNVAGLWNLEQLKTELMSCSLFITGDSGPLHLAAYLRVPTLAIWGPTQPQHFGYGNTGDLHHVTLGLACSPCFLHPASKPARACHGQIDCLVKLAPSVVAQKAIQVLSIKPSPSHPLQVTHQGAEQPQLAI